jgi:hypothetical protein
MNRTESFLWSEQSFFAKRNTDSLRWANHDDR